MSWRRWSADEGSRVLGLRVLLPMLVLVAAAALVQLLTPSALFRGEQERLLWALWQVESSGRTDPPDGDGGEAIGPLQIHRVYWQDALAAEPELGGTYEDCRRLAYAQRVVAAYMTRWAPEAWARGDAEVVARVHNGGPRGHLRAATLPYWRRVQAVLEGGR